MNHQRLTATVTATPPNARALLRTLGLVDLTMERREYADKFDSKTGERRTFRQLGELRQLGLMMC